MGSTLILRMVDRFPVIIYLGAGVLAWTAAKMLIHEPMLEDWMVIHPWLPWVVYAVIIGGVLLGGYVRNRGRMTGNIGSEGTSRLGQSERAPKRR